MAQFQTMKAVPHFSKGDCGDEKASRILGILPFNQRQIRARFFRLAHRVRVQNETHTPCRCTRSSGIRGGSQSLVNRTESCHFFSLRRECRALMLPRDARSRRLFELPFDCRPPNQSNISRASRPNIFLTLLTASSTPLLQII